VRLSQLIQPLSQVKILSPTFCARPHILCFSTNVRDRYQTHIKQERNYFIVFVFFTILYYDQQMYNFFHKLSHCYMFRHYRVILRQLVINSLPSYTSISNTAVGNTVLYYDQQMYNLFHKLSHCYMFRQYRVILRQLVINTLPSYTSISNAAVGNQFTIKMFHICYMQVLIL
jgi:hypothetical protein